MPDADPRHQHGLCPRCGRTLRYLGAATEAEPFWQRLSAFFRYPFHRDPLMVVAFCTLVPMFLGPGLFGVLVFIFLALVLFKYTYAVIRHTAEGHMKPPPVSTAWSGQGFAIGIQQMVRSDLASAGVMFSLDTETGYRDAVLISAAYGLGESVVQGTVNPDEYYVHKPTLLAGFRPVLQRKLGSKEFKLVYEEGGSRPTRSVPVRVEERRRFVLDEGEILTLARWACAVEEHYSRHHGQPTPMDMEWAKDGMTGELFLLQARPETVKSQGNEGVQQRFRLKGSSEILVSGRAIGQGSHGDAPRRPPGRPEDVQAVQETL